MPTVLAIPLGSPADGAPVARRARDLADLLGLVPDAEARLASAVAEVGGRDPGSGTAPASAPILVEVAVREAPVAALELSVIGTGTAVRIDVPLGADAAVPSASGLARAVLEQRERERLALGRRLEDADAALLALRAEADRAAAEADGHPAERTRFLRTLGHDLRTPLYATRGLLEELAAAPGLTEADLADVALLDGTIDEVLALLDGRLGEARDAEAAAGPRAEPVAVDALLRQLRGTVRAAAVARGEDIELRVTTVAPGLVVHSDPGRLARLLRAMVDHALGIPSGSGVDVGATPADDGRAVVFTVAGPGAAPEDLSVTRALAARLGGTLAAASAHGRGASYTPTIPSVAATGPGEA